MPDLANFREAILSEEDKPLFEEAISSAAGGAFRGAYILIWICCAESLKRKLKEASLRDNRAQQFVTEIEGREANKLSADTLILKRAHEYELVDDVSERKLAYIYDMRCIYSHPYESAPSEAELFSAASNVVAEVLEKPTLYRRKYVETLIDRLTLSVDFLERSKESVESYAREIAPRIDPTSYRHLANVYSSRLENMSDPSLADLFVRGTFFLPEFFKAIGTDFLTQEQWHDFVLGCPRTSQRIFLKNTDLYREVGQRAQNSLVSYAFTNAEVAPSGIKLLEPLLEGGELSGVQRIAFAAMDFHIMKNARLKTNIAYDKLIEELKSHTWPRQNAAIEMLNYNDRIHIASLTEQQQENLGRNILQAADGSSSAAGVYLTSLMNDYSNYPVPYIKGILFEGFLNESKTFRLKNYGLKKVVALFERYPGILLELFASLDEAQPSEQASGEVYEELINELTGNSELREYLINNRGRLSPSQA